MNKLLYLIILLFAVSCGQDTFGPGTEILAKLKDCKPGTDATPVIREINEKLTDNFELIIPKGTYTFFPEKAGEHYFITSNNDNGNYKVLLNLKGLKNVVIDGQGSELIFHGRFIPFNIEDAENITLRNFSIDWYRSFHSEGEVVNVSQAGKYFDIRISRDFPYRMEGDQLIWMEGWTADTWSKKEWRQDIRQNLFFDKESKATAYKVNRFKMNPFYPLLSTQYRAEELQPGLVRIYNSISELPKPGWIWVSKGALEKNRTSPAIRIFGSDNVKLENVTLHHAGAMGIIAERSSNITLENVNTLLPSDKERYVTTTADATHFVNCKGHIFINNCTFENMLDDATNIHGTYLKLVSKPGKNIIGVEAVHFQQNAYRWAEAGDTLVFRNNRTLEAYKTMILKEFRYINERFAELVFDEDVSDLLPDSGVENPKWNPSFTMTNSTVRNNRARSILLTSNKPILIENNVFERPMMAAIAFSGDMNFWFESGNVADVVIRNNTFIDACTGDQEQAVIQFSPVILDIEKATLPFHSNVVIDGNTFDTFDNPILDAFSVDSLRFTNNTIKKSGTFLPIYGYKPQINLRYSPNAVIENNAYEGNMPATVHSDQKSRESLTVNVNSNFIY